MDPLSMIAGPLAVLYICVGLEAGEACVSTNATISFGPDIHMKDEMPNSPNIETLRMRECQGPHTAVRVQMYVSENYGSLPFKFVCVPYDGAQDA